MTGAANPAAFMAKAHRALSGARLLLAKGDGDGACNRAYYAMFDAARAALLVAANGSPDASTKTHYGLISAFGRLVVQTGKIEAERGRALNQVQHLRQVADYSGDPVTLEDAGWAVEEATTFLAAITALTG